MKRIIICGGLIFIMYSYIFSYYDPLFRRDQLELDYIYGLIDEREYLDLLDYYYFQEKRPAFRLKPRKMKVDFISKSDSYIENSLGYSEFLKMEAFDLDSRFDLGILAVRADDTRLEKGYMAFRNKFVDKVVLGSFKAKFGLGLTIGQVNNRRSGFFYDLDMPRRRLTSLGGVYRVVYLDRNHLGGLAVDKMIKDFRLYFFVSNIKTVARDVYIQEERESINNGILQRSFGGALIYNKSKYFRLGITGFRLVERYLVNALSYERGDTIRYSALGVYNEIKGGDFIFEQELSRANDEFSYINKLVFDNKSNINFNISFRDYSKNYKNPYAGALSLHSQKTYFRARDERGIRFGMKYYFPNKKDLPRFRVDGRYDLYSYSLARIWNSGLENYEIIHNSGRTNQDYYIRLKYYPAKRLEHELKYQFIDRDILISDDSYVFRKNQSVDYAIRYRLPEFEARLRYSLKGKGIDIDDYSYFGDSLTLFLKFFLIKHIEPSMQIRLVDRYINEQKDERFSYIFRIKSRLNKNLYIDIKWYMLDKVSEEDLDLPSNEEINYYRIDALNRWEFVLSYRY